jgi:glycerol-3-phosphate dehydrogenase
VNRGESLARISGGHFNVLVIGGGITGAGIAWDGALRGLSVALLERTDFAAGTSGVSSKMAHAGFRYAESDPGLVREGGQERELMFRAGAHLARPVEYLLPLYEDTPDYDEGTLPGRLDRYDRLCGNDGDARWRWADPVDVTRAIPSLRRTPMRVASYRDGIMDDARITLEVIRSAADAGAEVANHAPVTSFIRGPGGRVAGVRFRDEAAGSEHTVTADAVVSAAGAFTDVLLEMAGEAGGAGESRGTLRPSRGMHLVFRSEATAGRAVVIPVGANVLYFLVPILRGYLAIGCTDIDYSVRRAADLDRVPVDEEEITWTLGLFDRAFPGAFPRGKVAACYTGVRPLVRPPLGDGRLPSESETSRAHRIWRTPGGLWVIAGGKFTTFRVMAEQLVDQVAADLAARGTIVDVPPCTTARRRYHGAPVCGSAWKEEALQRLRSETGLGDDICLHLAETYGTAAGKVGALVRADPRMGERIGEGRPFIHAEIIHAVREEMCLSAADFLSRRTTLRFREEQGRDVLPLVARRLGDLLGWSPAERDRQEGDYRGSVPVFR